ncbi:NAD(P)-binding protein [Clavulina sp. PMI_390]|nr:NAD(P)-binding protein [Clavulina sp. PMI_390]
MGRIVISGSSGVIGTAVVDYALKNTNHSLVLIDAEPPLALLEDSRIKYVTADLKDPEAWTEPLSGADGLIHLAAIARPGIASPQVTHNTNVALSYNALFAAADAGIKRVVLAGSINAIGGAWSPALPPYKYFPIDEEHPPHPEETYSISKLVAEIQADAIARAHPDMSIATLRFHYVNPPSRRPVLPADKLHHAKDLWGWTSDEAAARAVLLALEMGEDNPGAPCPGHEVFFIVGPTHCCPESTSNELVEKYFPGVEMRKKLSADAGFYNCSKAWKLLGWKHDGGLAPVGEW